MAIIRNTAAMRLKGSVGNTTYYTQGARQIARVSQNSSNYGISARRSPAQQRRRVVWANLVNFYKTSQNWMHGAFETKARNETDYNKFMSLNLPIARVALTKDQAAIGCCVYDSYMVSQGSLYSIAITRSGNVATTNIACNYLPDDLTNQTLGGLSAHLFGTNPWLETGAQLSFISYWYEQDNMGNPHLRLGRTEVCLDVNSDVLLKDIPLFEHIKNIEGRLCWVDLDPDNYLTVIHSNSSSGTIKVSTQSLVPGDEEMPASYATEAKVRAAMESYGVDPSYFLESGPEL